VQAVPPDICGILLRGFVEVVSRLKSTHINLDKWEALLPRFVALAAVQGSAMFIQDIPHRRWLHQIIDCPVDHTRNFLVELLRAALRKVGALPENYIAKWIDGFVHATADPERGAFVDPQRSRERASLFLHNFIRQEPADEVICAALVRTQFVEGVAKLYLRWNGYSSREPSRSTWGPTKALKRWRASSRTGRKG
jgi:hypothetical protein